MAFVVVIARNPELCRGLLAMTNRRLIAKNLKQS